ncbi:IS1634 family transposase [Methyloprofundus sp.]|uniref:IS1634 family transposase n=1 Tax=Methyloprofundus sp. TaxID=2020875 RepID=UPI003D0D4FFA
MYIRCTTLRTKATGETYKTFRLVESVRLDGKVKQHTLLNLGRYFDVPKSQWKSLSSRIDQLLTAQTDWLTIDLEETLETLAQCYAAQIIASRSTDINNDVQFETVDISNIELVRPRRVGVEQIALHAVKQLTLDDKLKSLGFNQHQLAASLGTIIARMASPASELATHGWLQTTSALGELIDYDFEDMGLDRLYQVSDQLWKHREAIETHLYQQERDLFSFSETITRYDLTNTFFEGEAKTNPAAQRGRSKEKRSDCPLVTLGLVLDGSGFPRKIQIFPGNASEPQTLQTILEGLEGRTGSTVILDAGIASEENIQYLIEHGFHYIVVSRKRKRDFDEEKATLIKDIPGQRVKVQKVTVEETGEIELYCHSQLREKKEQAMQDSFSEKYETALNSLHAGLSKKGTTKNYTKVLERLGRIKEKYARAAQHYEVTVVPDDEGDKANSISWKRVEKANSQATHPGVYCLRTNLTDWNEETLWRTYTMLTDLESVFRSLKSELGLRPIYHRKEERVNGHIFITLIAYHLVQTLRYQLKTEHINDSWQTIRRIMENQQRITVILRREDGKTIHLRKATNAEPRQSVIYKALEISAQPGGVKKTVI